MADVELDEEFLQSIAKRLEGEYLHVDDVDQSIVRTFQTRKQTGYSRRMTSIWPNWPLLCALCVLLGANWFFRRAIGLV